MYCKVCGKELKENQKFCSNCGALQETEEQNRVVEDAAENSAQHGMDVKIEDALGTEKAKGEDYWRALMGKFKKLNKRTQGIVIGAAVIVVLLLLSVMVNGKTVKMSKYVTITTDGYDGYGTATWEFDSVQFEKDYGKKLKFTREAKKEMEDFATPCEAAVIVFDGKIDKKEYLSNGDTVTFSWDDIDEDDVKEVYKNKFKFSDVSIKVEGLKKIESFDIFEDISIEYTGCEPYASANVVNNSKERFIQSLSFEIENGSNLSNGDTIRVKVSAYSEDDLAEYCAENYGKVPKTDEKEYTVEGLNSYVTSEDQIPDDFLDKMKGEVEDHLRSQAASDWDSRVSLENVTYIGTYILNKKAGAYTMWDMGENVVYVVYKVGVHEDFSDNGIDNHIEYYYYGKFNDVMLLADQTCTADLTAMTTCDNRFSRELEVSNGWWSTTTLYYYGYLELDSLFNKCVTSNIDNYTYEANVKDVGELSDIVVESVDDV